MSRKIKHNQNGFTLIELIVVMIIIGILVLIAAPRFINYIEKARYTRIINDTRIAEDVTTAYLAKHGKLPVDYDKDKVDHIEILKENQSYLKEGEIQFKDSTSTRKYSENDYLKYIEMINKNRSRRQNPPVGFQVEGDKDNFNFDYYKLPDEFVKKEIATRLKGDFLVNEEGFAIYTTKNTIEKPEEPEEPEKPEQWWPDTACEPTHSSEIYLYEKIGKDFSDGLRIVGFRDRYLMERGRRYLLSINDDKFKNKEITKEEAKLEEDRLKALEEKIGENNGGENEELRELKTAGIAAPKNITIPENATTDEIWLGGIEPEKIENAKGYSIYQIGDEAFYNGGRGYNIRGLRIDIGKLENIGKRAFANNEIVGLKDMGKEIEPEELELGEIPCSPEVYELSIPRRVERIEEAAFLNNNIRTLNFGKLDNSGDARMLKYIGKNAFSNNGMRAVNGSHTRGEFNLPENRDTEISTEIDDYAFSNTNSVLVGKENKFKEVTIPYTVHRIGRGSFENMEIVSVKIGAKYSINAGIVKNSMLGEIGKDAFSNNNIRNLSFQENIKKDLVPLEIGENSFANNALESMERIKYYGGVEIGDISENGSAIDGREIQVLKLPKSTVKIGRGSFTKNPKVDKVLIYNGIDENLQSGLLELEPEDINNVFDGQDFNRIYNGAEDKKLLNLPGLMVKEGEGQSGTWSYINDMETYIFKIQENKAENKAEIIGFTDEYEEDITSSMKYRKVETPRVYKLKESVENKGIKNHLVEYPIYSIGQEAFYNHDKRYRINYLKVNVPGEAQYSYRIKERAFADNDLIEVDIGSVCSIGTEAFKNNKIQRLNKPLRLTVFEEGVFKNNNINSLTGLTPHLNPHIQRIEKEAFNNNRLESLEISTSAIVEIQENAFRENPDLNKVFIRTDKNPNRDNIHNLGFPGDLSDDKTFKSVYESNIENRVVEMTRVEKEDGQRPQVGDHGKGYWILKELEEEEEEEKLPEQLNYRYDEEELTAEIIGFNKEYLKAYKELYGSGTRSRDMTKSGHKLSIRINLKNHVEKDGKKYKVLGVFDKAFKEFSKSSPDFEIGAISVQGNLSYIGKESFQGNRISRISYSNSGKILRIGESAFQDNNLKERFSIFDTKFIGKEAFADNNISDMTIFTKDKIEIGDRAFYNNLKLRWLTLYTEEVNIGIEAFSNSSVNINFKGIHIHSKKMKVEESAFRNNERLESVRFYPVGNRDIEIKSDETFPGENFKTLFEEIHRDKGGEDFTLYREELEFGVDVGKWELKVIALPPKPEDPYRFEDDTFVYQALSRNTWEKDAKVVSFTDRYLNKMKDREKTVIIPEKVVVLMDGEERSYDIKMIGNDAFSNEVDGKKLGYNIVAVRFPKDLLEIGKSSFENNNIKLLVIDTAKRNKKIGARAFADNKIEKLISPDNIMMYEEAFMNNELEDLVLGNGVFLRNGVFLGNRNLQTLTIGSGLRYYSTYNMFPGIGFNDMYESNIGEKLNMIMIRDEVGGDDTGFWNVPPEIDINEEGPCYIGGNFVFCNFNQDLQTVELKGYKEGYRDKDLIVPPFVIKRTGPSNQAISPEDIYRIKSIQNKAFMDQGLETIRMAKGVKEFGIGSFLGNDTLEKIIMDRDIEIKNIPSDMVGGLKASFMDKEAFPNNDEVISVLSREYLKDDRLTLGRPKYMEGTKWGRVIEDSIFTRSGSTLTGLANHEKIPEDGQVDFPDYYRGRLEYEPLKSIGNLAYKSKGIKAMRLPYYIESIGNEAFRDNELVDLDLKNNRDESIQLSDYTFADNKIRNRRNSQGKIEDFVLDEGHVIKNGAIGNEGVFMNNQLESVKFVYNNNRYTNQIQILNKGFMNNELRDVKLDISVDYNFELGDSIFEGNYIENLEFKLKTKGDRDISIGRRAFFANDLSKLEIPEGITRIGQEAFKSNMTGYLELSSKISEIGSEAFGNNELLEVEIPDGTSILDKRSFRDNPKLSKVTIKEKVNTSSPDKGLDDETFPGLDFKKVYMDNRGINNKYKKTYTRIGVVEDDRVKTGNWIPVEDLDVNNHSGLFKFVLDEKNKTAEIVGLSDDYNNSYNWSTLNIPSKVIKKGDIYSVSRIGNGAFNIKDSHRFRWVNFPDSLEEIGQSAFEGQDFLYLKIPDGIKKIEDRAFITTNRYSDLEYVELNKHVTLGENVFYKHGSFLEIFEDQELHYDGDRLVIGRVNGDNWSLGVYGDSKEGKKIELNGMIIVDYQPDGADKVETKIPGGIIVNDKFRVIKVIGERAFAGKGLNKLIYNRNMEYIQKEAFIDNNFQEIEIYPNIEKIEEGAFRDNPKLIRLNFINRRSSISYMNNQTFPGKNAKTMYDSMDAGMDIFLERRYIDMSSEENMIETGEWVRADRADENNETSLFKVEFNELDKTASINGFVENRVMQYNLTIPEIIIKEGKSYDVSKIGKDAFNRSKYNMSISTLTFPNTLLEIGESAFYDNNIFYVKIPDRVLKIGANAFRGTYCITNVDLNKSVDMDFGENAFNGMDNFLDAYENSKEVYGPIQDRVLFSRRSSRDDWDIAINSRTSYGRKFYTNGIGGIEFTPDGRDEQLMVVGTKFTRLKTPNTGDVITSGKFDVPSLKDLRLSKNIRKIEPEALRNNLNLTRISLGKSLDIGDDLEVANKVVPGSNFGQVFEKMKESGLEYGSFIRENIDDSTEVTKMETGEWRLDISKNMDELKSTIRQAGYMNMN